MERFGRQIRCLRIFLVAHHASLEGPEKIVRNSFALRVFTVGQRSHARSIKQVSYIADQSVTVKAQCGRDPCCIWALHKVSMGLTAELVSLAYHWVPCNLLSIQAININFPDKNCRILSFKWQNFRPRVISLYL